MNIFHLDADPRRAARMHCDKHVGKMLTEKGQMLSTGLLLNGEEAPWKKAFPNHPMNRWLRLNAENFAWGWELADELAREYVHRFGKVHAGGRVLPEIAQKDWRGVFGSEPFSTPPQCMPDEYKVEGDTIAAHRRFYAGEKARFARYTRRPIPHFMMDAALPMTTDEIAAAKLLAE